MSTTITRSIPPQRLVTGVNPAVRALIRSRLHGAVDASLLMLHVDGRRTGRRYDIPVGFVKLDDRLVVVTQHAWRANLRGGADLDVTHDGRRERMHARLDEEPGVVAATLGTVIERIGARRARQQLGLRITPPEPPTLAELEAAVREFDLATVTLTPRQHAPGP
jgi:hypothetical protein